MAFRPPLIYSSNHFPCLIGAVLFLFFSWDWRHAQTPGGGVGCDVPALIRLGLISTAPMVLRNQTAACSSCKRSATRHARPIVARPTALSASIPTPGCSTEPTYTAPPRSSPATASRAWPTSRRRTTSVCIHIEPGAALGSLNVVLLQDTSIHRNSKKQPKNPAECVVSRQTRPDLQFFVLYLHTAQ